jgi:putative endonuclease
VAPPLNRRQKAARSAATGRDGEDVACRFLEARGLKVLARNWRCRAGEVDVVARDEEFVVFVEVKGRRGASHGAGYESVDWGKRRRFIRAARQYAAIHGLSESPLRFDVISVDWIEGSARVRHDVGAFDADGQ